MKKNLFKFSLVFVFIVVFGAVGQVKADGPVTVHLEIESATSTLYNDFISVSACPEFPASATTTVNGLCALEQSGLAVMTNWQWAPSAFITSIGGASEDPVAGVYWFWFSDLVLGSTGINQHPLFADEHLLFVLGTNPLKISASDYSPFDGATTTISVLQFDPVAFDWIPAQAATVDFGWGATTTDINGKADIMATSSVPFSVSASKTDFLASNFINITPQVSQAKITIRDGATAVYSGFVNLPASNATSVNITPTAGGSAVAVPARSLLSVLETLDAAQNEFAITDLQYYPYFSPPSFYIKCMTVTGEANPLCNLWQYNLNGVYPWDSVDQAKLKNGDIVILYFGNQRQVSLSTNATTIGTSFIATAQKYDLDNSAYVTETGVTIGVTQPNPNDIWNPLEIATSTVDANGQAIFSLNTAGTYNIGIKEDWYFPLTAITVSAPVSSSGGSVIIQNSGGGSTATPPAEAKVDLGKAIDFLIAKQAADGSFGSALITDWAALALAAANPNGAAGQKVKNYLLTDPNPLVGMNPVSDYSRRAMALMSLNVSPYDGVATNYIKKIADLFDGQQFGDGSLYNDDIFALLVLNKAGYGASDEMIKKTVDFIIAKQQADGSWNGSDLTAAAVQALTPVLALNGASAALTKARNFLVNAQGADGGYGNAYTTPWVMQAIAALGESSGSWQKNNNTPESYLALSQGADGGLEKDNAYEANRVWSTAYAIPAVLGKPWTSLLNNFPLELAAPAAIKVNDLPASDLIATTTTATTTIIATTTMAVATSTLETADLATTTPEIIAQATSTEPLLVENARPVTASPPNNQNKPKEKIFIAAVEKPKAKTPRVLGEKLQATAPENSPAAPTAGVNLNTAAAAPAASPPAVKLNFFVLASHLIYNGLKYLLHLLGL